MKYWRTPLDIDQVHVPRGEVRILEDRCKGCGFCVEYCPKEILALSSRFNRKGYHPPEVVKEGECVNCNLCEMICPDFAIYSVEIPEQAPAEETHPAEEARPPSPAAEPAEAEAGKEVTA